MPATLVAEHVAPTAPAVRVSDLSNAERAVALYASDKPTKYAYKRGDEAQVEAWIVQGALRMGLEDLYQSAAFLRGFRMLAHVATSEQKKAHRARFPQAARLNRAESLASLSLLMIEVSDTAVQRNSSAQVEGACLCGGTGWSAFCFDPDEPTASALVACPGHNPNGFMPTPGRVYA